MKVYQVLRKDDTTIQVTGYLEIKQMGSLIFTGEDTDIIMAFGPGEWREVVKVYG